jgi:hypothetical protein
LRISIKTLQDNKSTEQRDQPSLKQSGVFVQHMIFHVFYSQFKHLNVF